MIQRTPEPVLLHHSHVYLSRIARQFLAGKEVIGCHAANFSRFIGKILPSRRPRKISRLEVRIRSSALGSYNKQTLISCRAGMNTFCGSRHTKTHDRGLFERYVERLGVLTHSNLVRSENQTRLELGQKPAVDYWSNESTACGAALA